MQLVPAAITLAYEKRRNRLSSAELTMTRETETSFRGIFEQLEAPIQLLLHSAAFLQYQRISREELALHLADACNWSRAEFERWLDACLDLYLLEGSGELRMHQLFASFVLATPISSETVAMLAQVRIVQGRRLVELASKLAAEPTRADLAWYADWRGGWPSPISSHSPPMRSPRWAVIPGMTKRGSRCSGSSTAAR